jgi:hypothetical protein
MALSVQDTKRKEKQERGGSINQGKLDWGKDNLNQQNIPLAIKTKK